MLCIPKMKVYLDTSVVSYLQQEDAPEKTAETQKLWELFKQGKYDVCLSEVTLREVGNCPEPKRSYLEKCLDEVHFTKFDITDDVVKVAEKIIEMRILTRKSFDDCLHIAAAIVNGCDYIISWNFKHIVNVDTDRGVKAVTSLTGYRSVEIRSPSYLLGSEG